MGDCGDRFVREIIGGWKEEDATHCYGIYLEDSHETDTYELQHMIPPWSDVSKVIDHMEESNPSHRGRLSARWMSRCADPCSCEECIGV